MVCMRHATTLGRAGGSGPWSNGSRLQDGSYPIPSRRVVSGLRLHDVLALLRRTSARGRPRSREEAIERPARNRAEQFVLSGFTRSVLVVELRVERFKIARHLHDLLCPGHLGRQIETSLRGSDLVEGHDLFLDQDHQEWNSVARRWITMA
jgi:hypothetical protein